MIAIIDYNAGNLTSVKLGLEELGETSEITSSREKILAADRVIFPGVGAAGSCMANIRERNLQEILREYLEMKKPLLAICVGAQIILESSMEDGDTPCLGIIPGSAKKFISTTDAPIKIPQIGWNQVHQAHPHPLFEAIPDQAEFYFVHSYYPCPKDPHFIFGQTTYGADTFASVLGKGNLMACQFHPEKSGRWGLQLLKNFCKWEVA